jgi:hypothetical protein
MSVDAMDALVSVVPQSRNCHLSGAPFFSGAKDLLFETSTEARTWVPDACAVVLAKRWESNAADLLTDPP